MLICFLNFLFSDNPEVNTSRQPHLNVAYQPLTVNFAEIVATTSRIDATLTAQNTPFAAKEVLV